MGQPLKQMKYDDEKKKGSGQIYCTKSRSKARLSMDRIEAREELGQEMGYTAE